MNLITKEELISKINDIFQQGWHKSVKNTVDTRNDGAVGNTLENLLGIKENNLAVPNANEWELKGQRSHTSSLITLKHIEPSPQQYGIVANLLLPMYGWTHKEAGGKYPENEMSFRSTTRANEFTIRGFKIDVDRKEEKIKFVFNHTMVNIELPEIKSWLNSVKKRVGNGPLNPEPYWGFMDLRRTIGEKINNCIYVIADRKIENKHEYFLYKELYMLHEFSFHKFLVAVENGYVQVDFDARTYHNHGTKFRIKQGYWKEIYNKSELIISNDIS